MHIPCHIGWCEISISVVSHKTQWSATEESTNGRAGRVTEKPPWCLSTAGKIDWPLNSCSLLVFIICYHILSSYVPWQMRILIAIPSWGTKCMKKKWEKHADGTWGKPLEEAVDYWIYSWGMPSSDCEEPLPVDAIDVSPYGPNILGKFVWEHINLIGQINLFSSSIISGIT